MSQHEQQFRAVHGKSSPQDEFQRRWDQLQPKVRQRWPQLTADDMQMIDGDARKLTALVHQRTGAELSDIEKEIEVMSDSLGNTSSPTEPSGSSPKSGSGMGGQTAVGDKSAATSQQTSASTVDRMGHAMSDGYRQVQRQLSAAPVTSTGLAFAAGAVLGYCLAAVYNDMEEERRRSERWYRRYW